MVIVEGPTDVWKWGEGAVATNGLQFTQDQILIIRSKPIRNLYIFFDNENYAQRSAIFLMKILAPYPKNIERITPKHKNDPGDMSIDEMMEIKKMLQFNEGL